MFLGLVVFNFVASLMHFGHNMAFFQAYPEPAWISGPWVVDALWFVMTPFLIVGYVLHRRRDVGMALFSVTTYCCMSLLVFGHYLYAPPWELSLGINFFIFFEGIAALLLLVYYLQYFIRQRQIAA